MSFKILEEQSVTVPDQTSSEVQMENWSKDVVRSYHEQEIIVRNQNSQSDDQLVTSSAGCLQNEQNKLVKQTAFEETKLPVENPRCFQVIDFRPEDVTMYCTTEKFKITEHRNSDPFCDFMVPFQVAENVDKDKTISLLQKELNILRISNKKLQEKLAQEGKELKTLKLELELLERATEAKIAEKSAGIVDNYLTDGHMDYT